MVVVCTGSLVRALKHCQNDLKLNSFGAIYSVTVFLFFLLGFNVFNICHKLVCLVAHAVPDQFGLAPSQRLFEGKSSLNHYRHMHLYTQQWCRSVQWVLTGTVYLVNYTA